LMGRWVSCREIGPITACWGGEAWPRRAKSLAGGWVTARSFSFAFDDSPLSILDLPCCRFRFTPPNVTQIVFSFSGRRRVGGATLGWRSLRGLPCRVAPFSSLPTEFLVAVFYLEGFEVTACLYKYPFVLFYSHRSRTTRTQQSDLSVIGHKITRRIFN